jgi:hypothetical protein
MPGAPRFVDLERYSGIARAEQVTAGRVFDGLQDAVTYVDRDGAGAGAAALGVYSEAH